MNDNKKIKNIDFLFEMGMLSNIRRSGLAFLGSGDQTIAEHSFRCAIIGHLLSQLTSLPHDPYKLLTMCLFHDAHEARTGDLNYLQQDYVSVDLEKLQKDVEALSPQGKDVYALVMEFENKTNNEAILAQDADKLELLLFLKEQQDLGNSRAQEWFQNAQKKLTTPEAQSLAEELSGRKADEWWKIRMSRKAQK